MLFAAAISSVLASSFVSAQFGYFGASDLSYSIKQGLDIFTSFFSPFFEVLVGEYSTSEFFFAKVLLLILLFVIVRFVMLKVPKFEDQRGVSTIIAAVVSILGVRYLREAGLIEGIILPYSVLAVSLLVGFVFFIYFLAVYKSDIGSLGRRLAWMFFGIVFVVLWLSRAPALSVTANWIYILTVIAVGLVFTFDRKIRSYFALWEIKGLERHISDKIVLNLLDELEKAEKHFDTEYGKREIKRIKDQLHHHGVSMTD